MTAIFIDGGHGTTGLEIQARLEGRSEFSLIMLDDHDRRIATRRQQALNDADVAILCLPDEAARGAVAMIDNDRTIVIDASSAHRTSPEWTYGFHEIFDDGREKLRSSKRISNPGCYPTGFLGLIKPLMDAGLVSRKTRLFVNAVSGYSGGGKSMIAEYTAPDGLRSAWRTYSLDLSHKHVPEMQRHAGLANPPIFAPSVANTYRGMIVEVALGNGVGEIEPSKAQICDVLRSWYREFPLVDLVTGFEEKHLVIEHAADSDRLDLFVFDNPETRQIRLIAALDNLGKGAAGACVQSLNIVTGHPETMGLRL